MAAVHHLRRPPCTTGNGIDAPSSAESVHHEAGINAPWPAECLHHRAGVRIGPVLTEYLAIFHASRLKNSGICHTEFTHSTSILQVLIIKRSSLEKIPAAISVPTYKLKEMLAQA